MKKQSNISRLLKFLAILLCIVLMNACGGDKEMATIAQDPNGDPATWEALDHHCWKGKLLEDIYKLVGTTTMNMYPKLIDGAMALMMIAFAFWLCFRIVKHVSSFSEESPAEVWTEVLQKLFLCFVCGLLASSTTSILFLLNTVIFPIYNAFLELGSTMIAHINHNSIEIFDKSWEVPLSENEKMEYSLVCKAGVLSKATAENGFPLEPQKMMSCLACSVSERLNFGYKLALSIMAKMPLMGIILGAVMMLFVFFVKIAFVFYLLDTLLRFGIMLMILPLLIMAYPFKTTRNWVKIGFFTILNSAGFLMMISIVITLILLGIQQILQAYNGWLLIGLGPDKSLGGWKDLGVPFIVILMVILLLISSVKIAKEINDNLISGGGEATFQRKVLSIGVQAVKATAFALGGKVAGKVVSRITDKFQNKNNGSSA